MALTLHRVNLVEKRFSNDSNKRFNRKGMKERKHPVQSDPNQVFQLWMLVYMVLPCDDDDFDEHIIVHTHHSILFSSW